MPSSLGTPMEEALLHSDWYPKLGNWQSLLRKEWANGLRYVVLMARQDDGSDAMKKGRFAYRKSARSFMRNLLGCLGESEFGR